MIPHAPKPTNIKFLSSISGSEASPRIQSFVEVTNEVQEFNLGREEQLNNHDYYRSPLLYGLAKSLVVHRA